MTEAPQCENRCQYAQDVGMPEHSCAGKCMYLNHPDNQEVTMKVGDTVQFCNPDVINFYGVTGVVLEVDEDRVTLKDTNGKTRVFLPENCRVVDTPAPADDFDVVAKPKHYQFFPDVEAIDIIARSMTVTEFRGYCLGNRLKYRLRAGAKDDPKQELDKSDAYLKLFERCKGLCYAE